VRQGLTLKNTPVKGSVVPDYFDGMRSRIRDIRAGTFGDANMEQAAIQT